VKSNLYGKRRTFSFLISFLSSPFRVILHSISLISNLHLFNNIVNFIFVFSSFFACLFVIYPISLFRQLIHNDCTPYSAIFGIIFHPYYKFHKTSLTKFLVVYRSLWKMSQRLCQNTADKVEQTNNSLYYMKCFNNAPFVL
jgi:hypothetical protein